MLSNLNQPVACSDAGYPWRVTSVKPLGRAFSVSLREMSCRVRNKYDSTTADYKVVDTGMVNYRKDRYQTQWSKEKGKKNTYIDQIFAQGTRKERSSPSPNAYKPDRIGVEKPSTVS